MRIGRKELLLIAGLIAASAVAFSGQLSDLRDAWRTGEAARHIGFLPGLAFMAIVLLVYVQTKRQELEVLAAAVAEEARLSQERARELERLVAFWKALTQSLDIDAVRETASHHLPDIARSPEVWVVTGEGGTWARMLGPAAVRTPSGEADITDLALGALALPGISEMPEGVEYEGQLCFPLVAAGATLGALGVPAGEASMDALRRQVVGAAAALVGVSVRSANLLRDVRENSLRDSLTGCSTRACAMEMVSAELKRARRARSQVSLLMIDVDHFKSINDRHGHLCGDGVLAAIGTRLRSTPQVERPEVPLRRRGVPGRAARHLAGKAPSAPPRRCARPSRSSKSPGTGRRSGSPPASASPRLARTSSTPRRSSPAPTRRSTAPSTTAATAFASRMTRPQARAASR